MKLDRNINPDDTGKYALLKLRELKKYATHMDIQDAINLLKDCKLIHFGNEGPGEQFFVMKHKDKYTPRALSAYANAVLQDAVKTQNESLLEYGEEVAHEARLAGRLEGRIPD